LVLGIEIKAHVLEVEMSVDETDKIDILVTDKEKTYVLLVIADHLDWDEFDEGHHLELLQDKINAYLHFVESGELVQRRPDLKGLPVTIQVDAKYPPSKKAVEFYRIAGPIVAEAGVSLQLHVPSTGTTTRF
jgi:hypothetical protein